jgi:hypothetical protein
MNTAREALFKAMLQHGWFTASGGSDESPLGIFGYVINTQPELKELYEAFEDVIKAYGKPNDEDVIGNFFAYLNGNGVIHIYRYDKPVDAENQHAWNTIEHEEWLDRKEI